MKGATLPIKRLSDTPQICMLLYPAFYIIQEISVKAAENLNWSAVIPTPGVQKESFVVQNSVSPMELLISNFKTSCKDKCKLNTNMWTLSSCCRKRKCLDSLTCLP